MREEELRAKLIDKNDVNTIKQGKRFDITYIFIKIIK